MLEPSSPSLPHAVTSPASLAALQRLTPREMTPVTCDALADEAKTTTKKKTEHHFPPLPPLVLRVAIRPGRMTMLTTVSIGLIIAMVVVLHHGHELARFVKKSKTPAQQSRLLDQYNSYAGNVAAVFGKPIELFVTAAVQVLVLRFLTRLLLRPQPDRRVTLFALVTSTGVGYMIGNGFNALNVQFHELPVQPVILASDLSAESIVANSQFANRTSTVNQSISERTLANPTTNTVLRSLVLPRESKPVPKCNWLDTQLDFPVFIPDDVIEYGMPQREWMKELLPVAPETQTFRVVINATNKTANQGVKATDLPMPARRAANLFLHSVFLSSQYVPWGKRDAWGEQFVNETFLKLRNRNISTAVLAGLMPPDPSSVSELEQREWLLAKSVPMLSRLFAGGTENMSTTDIAMEFSHTKISPFITFDAMTFELDVDPKLYTTARDKKTNTRYYELGPRHCQPWPGRCLIGKEDRPPFAGLQSEYLSDAPMVVHAFASCLDNNGSEKLYSAMHMDSFVSDFNVQQCETVSNSSMILVSVAKRLKADALLENHFINASGVFEGEGAGSLAANLTKTYTFTVGRLGWTLLDLAEKFRAQCGSGMSECSGLTMDLTDGKDQLIVGTHALPLGLLSGVYFIKGMQQRPTRLVQITEPPRHKHPDYKYVAGDLLLPHNVKNLQWQNERTKFGENCSAHQEDRVRFLLDNHLYMESTLQPAYTAGMFFLFQDAVPKPVLRFGTNNQTLDFDGNVHEIALWLSIPIENTVLTISGCVVLSLALFVALLWSLYCRFTKRPDLLTHITTPHVIARAMLDESQFPSLLLHRRVMDTSDGFTQKTVAAFEIQSLLLQNQTNSEHRVAASA